MFRNYFKTAFRNLAKRKGFSAINIIGLACGIASCLLIVFYVLNELKYDQYNTKVDRIYRIDGDLKFGGHHFILAQTPDGLGAALKKEFPQVEQYVRFRDHGGVLVKKGNENVLENRVILADSTLFDVFTLPMLAGDPHSALKEPHSVVITKTAADKYFKNIAVQNVVGKYLTINDTGNYKITGVIKDVPQESHFHYDLFISIYGQLSPFEIDQWASNNFNTYIVLKNGSDVKNMGGLLDDFVMDRVEPLFKSWNLTREQFKKQGDYLHYTLMPLSKIHLYSDKTGELENNGSIQYVYIFSTIAFFILLIACVNFMNLSTARSAGRAMEVGVRKVLGSTHKNLVFQFLTESLVITFLSTILAIAIAALLLPYFNEISGKAISLNSFFSPWIIPALLVVVFVVGIMSGIYPALYMSSFKPIRVLKGKLAGGMKTGWLRSTLVVFQFSISIFLIIGTLVIYLQLNFIRNKDVGYDRDQVIVLNNTDALGNAASVFKKEVVNMPGVKSATMTGFLPTSAWRSDSPVFPEAVADSKSAISTQIWDVDEDYIPTLGMKIIEGRNFSKDFLTDSSALIVNESFAKLIGFKDPVSKPVYFMDNFPVQDFVKYNIVGVVKNFNFNSLHAAVSPLVMKLHPQRGSIAIRINTSHSDKVISSIESLYKSLAPAQPFNYSFMDADFNKIYSSEQKMGDLSLTFSALAILIACLGLFGLISFAAEQRTKEIGIRKVLGASVSGIVSLLSKDFLLMVCAAIIIASPLAWYFMNNWLADFAYRIQIKWWYFFIAGAIAIVVAMATVSFQAVKAATANPVKNLRTE